MIGHTALLSGTASKAEQVITFSIAIDSPLDHELIGTPFESVISEPSMVALGVRLFHGVDFTALDGADGLADSRVALIDPELDPALPIELVDAYYQVRADFQTHEWFAVQPREL